MSAAAMQHLGWAGVALVSLLCVDQASKALLLRWLAPDDDVRLAGGVRLRRAVNVRWAPGARSSPAGSLLRWALTCSSAALLLAVSSSPGKATVVGIGIAVGGATGNLLDWLFRGGVVDFVDLRFWPVFNVGDAAIVVGVGLLVWGVVH